MSKKMYAISQAALEYRIEEERIIHFIEERWITPCDESGLDEEDMARVKLILDLQDLFEVNDAAVPIILHLLDQLLRTRAL